MTIPVANCGVWTLDDTYKKISSSKWPVYTDAFDSGTLWTWGFNSSGQLGLGDLINRSSPSQVQGESWLRVGMTRNEGYAVKSDCTLWSWGQNYSGLSGLDNTIPRSSPAQVPGTWLNVFATQCGEQSFFQRTNCTIFGVGRNQYGGLGDSSFTARSSPIQVGFGSPWICVAPGDKFTIAIFGSFPCGTFTTGHNYFGQLGQGLSNTYCRTSFGGVGTSNFTCKISAGCVNGALITTNCQMRTWGLNSGGRLGINNAVPFSCCVSTPVPGIWCDVKIGNAHGVAIRPDGTMWSWGAAGSGNLGLTNNITRSSPTQIPGDQWFCVLATGNYHTFAKKTDGTVWGWGRNSAGQLGLGDLTDRSSPVQIPGNWLRMGASENSSIGVKQP